MLSPWVQFVPIKLAAVEQWNFIIKPSRTVGGIGYFCESVIFMRDTAVVRHFGSAPTRENCIVFKSVFFVCFIWGVQIKVAFRSWYLFFLAFF